MTSIVTKNLLSKDLEPNGKNRLYKVKFYNDLQMFLVGKSLEEALYNAKIGFKYRKRDGQYYECVGYKVNRFYVVPSWKDLMSKQEVIRSYIDSYRRQVIELTDFMVFYDDYNNNYYVVNKQTGQSIVIK